MAGMCSTRPHETACEGEGQEKQMCMVAREWSVVGRLIVGW